MADPQTLTNTLAALQLGREMDATRQPPKVPLPGFPASDPAMVGQTWYETGESGASGNTWLNNVDTNVDSSDHTFMQMVPILPLSYWASTGDWDAISSAIETHPDWPLSQVWALVTQQVAAQMWPQFMAAFQAKGPGYPHPLPDDFFNAWVARVDPR